MRRSNSRTPLPWSALRRLLSLTLLATLALGLAACDDASTVEPPITAEPEPPLPVGGEPEPPLVTIHVDPPRGSMAGYYPVAFDVSPLLDPTEVLALRVDGRTVIELEPGEGEWMVGLVQGSDQDGPVLVEAVTADGVVDLGAAFTYEPPPHPAFRRIVSFGASVSQGVQRGVPTRVGSLMAPGAQLARQLRGYMALPVLIEGLFTPMGVDLVGPAPQCETPQAETFIVGQLQEVIPRLTNPETGSIDVSLGRLDPDIAAMNVAFGNARAGYIARTPDPGDVAAIWLSHLAYDPYGNPFGPPPNTLDTIAALEPTLVVSFDMYGNDIAGAINARRAKPESVTDAAELYPDITTIVERLAALDAEVFLGNLPRPSRLSRTAEVRFLAESEGRLEEEEQQIAAVDALATAANAHLAEQAARFENVHVVDLYSAVEALAARPVDLGDQVLNTTRFGGLVGLDGLHFCDTGYAYAANVAIVKINEVLGTDVPPIDLAAVAADDPDSPNQLLEAGFDWAACRR